MMTTTGVQLETARMFLRVSTGGQNEESQIPECVNWCDLHGYAYNLDDAYVVHGKSAYKGGQDADLDRAFADMTAGLYTVLVVWALDRLERRGALAALTLAERARKAGGRIEYVQDTYLNTSNEMSDVMLAFAGSIAQGESRRKSRRIKAKQNALRAAGSVVGRAPWGFEIVTLDDGRKVLEPTSQARRWIPEIFRMATYGSTMREIAELLDAHGVRTQEGNLWNEAVVGNRIIKNPVYYGSRRNGGNLETEPLVSFSAWSSANAALTARGRVGYNTTVNVRAMLAPVCGNSDCDATGRDKGPSPMYRLFAGKPREDGTRPAYYRCAGRGPQRKGCGNMIPCAVLDAHVTDAMLADRLNMRVDRVFVAGDDRAEQIGKLRQTAMEAYARGDKQRFRELDAEADTLDALPAVRAHWEDRQTGQTEGGHFASLDVDGQRSELAENWEIHAHMGDDGLTVSIARKSQQNVTQISSVTRKGKSNANRNMRDAGSSSAAGRLLGQRDSRQRAG